MAYGQNVPSCDPLSKSQTEGFHKDLISFTLPYTVIIKVFDMEQKIKERVQMLNCLEILVQTIKLWGIGKAWQIE